MLLKRSASEGIGRRSPSRRQEGAAVPDRRAAMALSRAHPRCELALRVPGGGDSGNRIEDRGSGPGLRRRPLPAAGGRWAGGSVDSICSAYSQLWAKCCFCSSSRLAASPPYCSNSSLTDAFTKFPFSLSMPGRPPGRRFPGLRRVSVEVHQSPRSALPRQMARSSAVSTSVRSVR